MSTGFRVDLGALRSAADGIADTIDQTSADRVHDVDPPHDSFGHDALGGTFGDFCERWDIGVTHLCDDAAAIALVLRACADDYEQTDEAVEQGIDGVLVRVDGPDPAAP